MEILNVGPLELMLIIILALVVLGPEGVVRGARSVGRFINKVIRSPVWRDVAATSRDIRDLPTQILHETGLDETSKELQETLQGVKQEVAEAAREVDSSLRQAAETAQQDIRQPGYPIGEEGTRQPPQPEELDLPRIELDL